MDFCISNVQFICQNCNKPIIVDSGFQSLDEITKAEITLPHFEGKDVDFGDEIFDKVVEPFQPENESTFTIIEKAICTEKSQQHEVLSKLFNIVNSNSEIDHPLCEDCTSNLKCTIEEFIIMMREELKDYENYIAEYESRDKLKPEELADLEHQLASLNEEEERLLAELNKLEAECEETKKKIEKNKEERQTLEQEEDKYLKLQCTYELKINSRLMENRSYQNQLIALGTQLAYLKQKNIFNTTFEIVPAKHFGMINSLRLGRLPAKPVSSAEINAAWGQTVLFFSSLSNKLGLKYTRYRLCPHGNSSYIEELSTGKELPLHESNRIMNIFDYKFDAGMVAFLDCLAEFDQFIEKKCKEKKDIEKTVSLPYKVNGQFLVDPKHGAVSIKTQANEKWTKALKFLLINLTWGLTFAAKLFEESGNK